MKKISIIIPIYNIEIELIRRCVSSIVQQQYDNYEILLVLNGGTKEYYTLVKQQNWGERVNIICLEQAGVSNARNQGLKQITGDYVVFIDGDDIIYPNYFHEAVLMIEEYDLDMVSGGFSYLYQDGEISCLCNKEFQIYEGKEKQKLLKALLAGNMGDSKEEFGSYLLSSPCAKMYKTHAIANIQFFTEIYKFEDLVYIYELFCNLERIGVVKKKWYGYYQYAGSAIHKKNDFNLVDNNYKVIKQLQNIGVDKELEKEYMFFCMQGIKDCFFQNIDLTKEQKKNFDIKMLETFFSDITIRSHIAHKNPYYVSINRVFARIIQEKNIRKAWRFIRLNLFFLYVIQKIKHNTLKCFEYVVVN